MGTIRVWMQSLHSYPFFILKDRGIEKYKNGQRFGSMQIDPFFVDMYMTGKPQEQKENFEKQVLKTGFQKRVSKMSFKNEFQKRVSKTDFEKELRKSFEK